MYSSAPLVRYGTGIPLRVTEGYAPMGVFSAQRYAQNYASGNPGMQTPGVPGLSGLTFDGTGLFGTGLFGSSAWGVGEWATIGLGAYFVLKLGFGLGSGSRRKKLAVIRDKYQLARDTA
jgi:hypothetical protein